MSTLKKIYSVFTHPPQKTKLNKKSKQKKLTIGIEKSRSKVVTRNINLRIRIKKPQGVTSFLSLGVHIYIFNSRISQY